MYKILVPIDGSDHSLKALHIACDLAEKYKAVIVLLHVIGPAKNAEEILSLPLSRKFGSQLTTKLHEIADEGSRPIRQSLLSQIGEKILEIAANRVKRLGIEVQTLALAEGDPAENILIAHKLVAASTIVMGSRGGNWSTLSSFGSVSNTVFAKADCTCISVK